MYFVINDLVNPAIPEDNDNYPFLEIHEELLVNPRQGWHSGEVLSDPPIETIEIEATQHFGYQGAPPDYYDDSISLMSPRLLAVLHRVGINNIQVFPAVICYRGTGEKHDMYAFNILGCISVVDLENSNIVNSDGQLLYNCAIDGFTINTSKTNRMDLHIFRLAENVMITLVSDILKNAIEQAGINTFAFTETKDLIRI